MMPERGQQKVTVLCGTISCLGAMLFFFFKQTFFMDYFSEHLAVWQILLPSDKDRLARRDSESLFPPTSTGSVPAHAPIDEPF